MENSNSKLILSFLAGLAAGTAVGILLAPDSGENTRKKIKSRMDELETDIEKEAKKQFDDLSSGFNKVMADIREKSNDLIKKGEEKVNETRKG